MRRVTNAERVAWLKERMEQDGLEYWDGSFDDGNGDWVEIVSMDQVDAAIRKERKAS